MVVNKCADGPRPLPINRRGRFFEDPFFQGHWDHCNSAVRNIVDRFNHGFHSGFNSRGQSSADPHYQSAYRSLRDAKMAYATQSAKLKEYFDEYKLIMDVREFVGGTVTVKFSSDSFTVQGILKSQQTHCTSDPFEDFYQKRYGSYINRINEDKANSVSSTSTKTLSRKFNLPDDADSEAFQTLVSKDSILSVTIPKKNRRIIPVKIERSESLEEEYNSNKSKAPAESSTIEAERLTSKAEIKFQTPSSDHNQNKPEPKFRRNFKIRREITIPIKLDDDYESSVPCENEKPVETIIVPTRHPSKVVEDALKNGSNSYTNGISSNGLSHDSNGDIFIKKNQKPNENTKPSIADGIVEEIETNKGREKSDISFVSRAKLQFESKIEKPNTRNYKLSKPNRTNIFEKITKTDDSVENLNKRNSFFANRTVDAEKNINLEENKDEDQSKRRNSTQTENESNYRNSKLFTRNFDTNLWNSDHNSKDSKSNLRNSGHNSKDSETNFRNSDYNSKDYETNRSYLESNTKDCNYKLNDNKSNLKDSESNFLKSESTSMDSESKDPKLNLKDNESKDSEFNLMKSESTSMDSESKDPKSNLTESKDSDSRGSSESTLIDSESTSRDSKVLINTLMADDMFDNCWTDYRSTLQDVVSRLTELSSELGEFPKLLAASPVDGARTFADGITSSSNGDVGSDAKTPLNHYVNSLLVDGSVGDSSATYDVTVQHTDVPTPQSRQSDITSGQYLSGESAVSRKKRPESLKIVTHLSESQLTDADRMCDQNQVNDKPVSQKRSVTGRYLSGTCEAAGGPEGDTVVEKVITERSKAVPVSFRSQSCTEGDGDSIGVLKKLRNDSALSLPQTTAHPMQHESDRDSVTSQKETDETGNEDLKEGESDCSDLELEDHSPPPHVPTPTQKDDMLASYPNPLNHHNDYRYSRSKDSLDAYSNSPSREESRRTSVIRMDDYDSGTVLNAEKIIENTRKFSSKTQPDVSSFDSKDFKINEALSDFHLQNQSKGQNDYEINDLSKDNTTARPRDDGYKMNVGRSDAKQSRARRSRDSDVTKGQTTPSEKLCQVSHNEVPSKSRRKQDKETSKKENSPPPDMGELLSKYRKEKLPPPLNLSKSRAESLSRSSSTRSPKLRRRTDQNNIPPPYVTQKPDPYKRFSGFGNVSSDNVKRMREAWRMKQDKSSFDSTDTPPSTPRSYMRPYNGDSPRSSFSSQRCGSPSTPGLLSRSPSPNVTRNSRSVRSPDKSRLHKKDSACGCSRPNCRHTVRDINSPIRSRRAESKSDSTRGKDTNFSYGEPYSSLPSSAPSTPVKKTSKTRLRSSDFANSPTRPTISSRAKEVSTSKDKPKASNRYSSETAASSARNSPLFTRENLKSRSSPTPSSSSTKKSSRSHPAPEAKPSVHKRVYKRIRDSTLQPDSETLCFIEQGDQYKMVLDVAEFVSGEVEVLQDDKSLTVKGTREEGNTIRTFHRSFNIPTNSKEEDIDSALSTDGILTITVPKKRERVIKIELVD